MAKQSSVVYDNFSGGEYGLLGGLLAPPGSWTGKNVMVYQNGAIGPRCGLKNLGVTGAPGKSIRGMGWCSYAGKEVWFVADDDVYGFSDATPGGAVFTYTGSLGATPSYPVAAAIDPAGTYITNFGDATYLINHATTTVTELSGSPGGRCIAMYGGRMLIGGIGTGLNSGNRIMFSEIADYNTWPSVNFLDIGDGWQIRAIFPQRTHLLIAKEDGSWWVLSGTLGGTSTDFSVRKVFGGGVAGSSDPAIQASAPWSPTDAVMLENGDVLFIPNGRDYPARFTGSFTRHDKYLQWLQGANTAKAGNNIPPTLCMRVLNYDDEVAVVSGTRLMLLHEGVWSFHTFDVPTDAWLVAGSRDHFVVASAGDNMTSTPPVFYTARTYINRPGQAGAIYESAGDGSDTMFPAQFTLPEKWAKDGDEVLVRHVVIDFLKHLPNTAQTNHFDLTVTALRKYQATSSTSPTKSYDAPQGEGTLTGVQQRIQLDFAEQGYGNGFQLNFSNLRGVAIQKIQVITETKPEQVV